MTLKLGYTTDEKDDYQGLYLPAGDRSTHLYALGSSGVGKLKACTKPACSESPVFYKE